MNPPGTAPHIRTQDTVQIVMRQVVFALMPAIIAHYWFFGPGILINIAIACLFAVATEYISLRIRGENPQRFIAEGSALVAAVLLAMCLPPLCPWWVTATGTIFAIAVAKHMYGGLGNNIFNPAMAGYVVILISFPDALSYWIAPDIGDIDYVAPTLSEMLRYTATGQFADSLTIDAISRATPLDTVQTELGMMLTISEIRVNPLFGDFGGRGWEWIANFTALGGIWLLIRGIIRWQAPVAMLLALCGLASLGYIVDASRFAGPGFHLFSGGAMLGAFFIATDPVSGPTTNKGRLIFGAGIGALVYVIRTWGSYADGVAFAVLLMNMTVPLIDRFSQPRIYGRTDNRHQDNDA